VNWLTNSSPPGVPCPSRSCTLRFIFPASSEKMRSFSSLASSLSAVCLGVSGLGAHQHQQARTNGTDGFAIHHHTGFAHALNQRLHGSRPFRKKGIVSCAPWTAGTDRACIAGR
jgi:hypothetical protein